jgi:hypothetical protein
LARAERRVEGDGALQGAVAALPYGGGHTVSRVADKSHGAVDGVKGAFDVDPGAAGAERSVKEGGGGGVGDEGGDLGELCRKQGAQRGLPLGRAWAVRQPVVGACSGGAGWCGGAGCISGRRSLALGRADKICKFYFRSKQD